MLVAPLLFVAAATGLLYALSFQAENVLYRHELRVPAGDTVRPLTEQVAAAKAAHPEGTVTAVWPSPERGATTRVLMNAPGLGADESLAVFVNPYDNEVRGALPSTGSIRGASAAQLAVLLPRRSQARPGGAQLQ